MLANQNRDLEPPRRSGSQANLARLIRDLSQGIFTALRNVIECNCSFHNLGLEIAARNAAIMLNTEEDQAARSLRFDIVVSINGQEHSQSWDRVRIQVAEKDIQPDLSKTPSPQHALPPPPRSKSPRRFKFASLPTRHTSDKNLVFAAGESQNPCRISVLAHESPPMKPAPIKNLCRILQKGKRTAFDCFGSITDMSRKFNLYAQDCHPENSTTEGSRRPTTTRAAIRLSRKTQGCFGIVLQRPALLPYRLACGFRHD